MKNKGFTLVEVLVVIIIIGILATIGTPLYTGYVKDARAAEADAALSAIITGEKYYRQKMNSYIDCKDDKIKSLLGIDLTDMQFFTCEVTNSSEIDFTVICRVSDKGVDVGLPSGGRKIYTHSTKEWKTEGWGN